MDVEVGRRANALDRRDRRATDKHCNAALEAGVSQCLTKPYTGLLNHVRVLMGEQCHSGRSAFDTIR